MTQPFADWGEETAKSINEGTYGEDNLMMYLASHCVAEKRFWELADEKLGVDFSSSMFFIRRLSGRQIIPFR